MPQCKHEEAPPGLKRTPACCHCAYRGSDKDEDILCQRYPPVRNPNLNFAVFPVVRAYYWCGEYREEQ